jgi:hypothetical protein
VASLLGIPRLRIAVNKMDLVDFSWEVFDVIVAQYLDFATRLGVADVKVLPISALSTAVRGCPGTRGSRFSSTWTPSTTAATAT